MQNNYFTGAVTAPVFLLNIAKKVLKNCQKLRDKSV